VIDKKGIQTFDNKEEQPPHTIDNYKDNKKDFTFIDKKEPNQLPDVLSNELPDDFSNELPDDFSNELPDDFYNESPDDE